MADSSLWGTGLVEVQIPGPPGPTGPAPYLVAGPTTIGEANVDIIDLGDDTYQLNFTVPIGPQGAEGPAGPAAGFSSITVNTLPAGQPASGSISGTAPNYELILNLPTGPTGGPGPSGPPGESTAILSGGGPPTGATGNIGDFYIDLLNARFYGPKVAEDEWPTTYVSIVGPPGEPGIVQEIVAGDGIEVDSTDQAAPEISAKVSGDADNILEVSANDQGLYVPATVQNLTDIQRSAIDALDPQTATLEDLINALQME